MPNGDRLVLWGWLALTLCLCSGVGMAAEHPVADAGTGSVPATQVKADSLISAWLAFPQLEQVSWPYTYMSVASDDAPARRFRQDLLEELSTLRARLQAYRGRDALQAAVGTWQDHLRGLDATRVPGDWSPAALMSYRYQRPSIGKISALGACALPDWVEVWDSRGVTRVAWRGGLRLSDLLSGSSALHGGADGHVAIVDPLGEIVHRGIQAWNFADEPLQPGARIVATLPLGGDAFPWIRDAIARVLAHAPPGDTCRESKIVSAGGPDE